MTPQEHYDEAEVLLGRAFAATNDTAFTAFATRAQVHAALALAGFTRDAATGADHVHDHIGPTRTVGVDGFGYSTQEGYTTEPGRPA
jgi:hypothetical protein